MRVTVCVLVVVACVLVLGVPVEAAEIYAVMFDRNRTASDSIIKFDSADPTTLTVVGSTGAPLNHLFTGLDFDAGGDLYAYARDENSPDLVGVGLYRINKATGQGTFVGGGGLDSGAGIKDLSYNPVTQTMLGVGSKGTAQNTVNQLYSINLLTGMATKVGDITPPAGFLITPGLAVDASGNVFVHDTLTGSMMQLDGLLNATALPNPLGFNAFGIHGMTFDWARDDAWYLGGERNFVPFPAEFRTVDRVTGIATFVDTIGATGFEFGGPGDIAIDPVPEPGAGMMLGVVLLSVWRWRR